MDAALPPAPLHELVRESRLVTSQAYLKALLFLRSLLLLLFLFAFRLRLLLLPCFSSIAIAIAPAAAAAAAAARSSSWQQLLLHCIALLCEIALSLQAHLAIPTRWRFVERAVHPSRLLLLLLQQQQEDIDQMQLSSDTEQDVKKDKLGRHHHPPAHAQYRQLLQQLPPVDVLVTTADPGKEPPIIALNTLLSAMALHYSPHRLACYVSDDGASILTFWAISLAASFATLWLPFCRLADSVSAAPMAPRAPGPYFLRHKHPPSLHDQHHLSSSSSSSPPHFISQWNNIKAKYEELELRVTSMTRTYLDPRTRPQALAMILADFNSMDRSSCSSGGGGDDAISDESLYAQNLKRSVVLESWAASDYDPRQHHAYCEILIGHRSSASQSRRDIVARNDDDLPCLVYMSREKSLAHNHHYKAGNMNALLRVSGIFTNAPFILNLDCDMYVNDGQALLQSMCFFMDRSTSSSNPDRQLAFVQFPQAFEWIDESESGGGPKAAMEVFFKGWDSAQGPAYCGTCCVHQREILYGKAPDRGLEMRGLGCSTKLIGSAARITAVDGVEDDEEEEGRGDLGMSRFDVEEAVQLMSCSYEDGTDWGKEIGFMYGSMSEDVLTSLRLHGKGWRSAFCSPKVTQFLGRFPGEIRDLLIMRRRWATGCFQILVGAHSPLIVWGSTTRKLGMRQRLNYLHILNAFSLASALPLTVYSLLPAASLLLGLPLYNYPTGVEDEKGRLQAWGCLMMVLAWASIYGCNCVEAALLGIPPSRWWDSECSEAMVATSAVLFAGYDVVKKLVGISDVGFEVTPKGSVVVEEQTDDWDGGKQEDAALKSSGGDRSGVSFDSALLVPPTAIVMLNLAALSVLFIRSLLCSNSSSSSWWRRQRLGPGCVLAVAGRVEAWCCAWVLLLLRPFTLGLVSRIMGRSPPAACLLHPRVVLRASSLSLLLLALLLAIRP